MSIKENVEHKLDWEDLLNREKPRKSVIWDYRGQNELETFWMSDVHLGSNVCDEELFLKNLEFIKQRGMPFADLGDLVENSTRNSIGSGVYDQKAIADAQVEMAVQRYTPVKHLLKSMQPGNHEIRTYKDGGVNLTKQITKRLGVPYGGAGLFHVIKVGNQTYTVYSSHGGSGATTVGGKFNALKRQGDIFPSADVVIQGHIHETLYHSRELMSCDGRGQVRKHKQHLVSNGAYLNWWGSYGQVKGYSPTNKGNAKITFWGDRRMVEVSFI